MYVEVVDVYGGLYIIKWIIENNKGRSSKRFNNKSMYESLIWLLRKMLKSMDFIVVWLLYVF